MAEFIDSLTNRQLLWITAGCYCALCLMVAASFGFDIAAEYRKDRASSHAMVKSNG